MEFLNILNSNIIYLYLIVCIPLLFFTYKLIKEILVTVKGINTIKDKTNKIKDNMEIISQKKEKIDYTSKHSLPLFVNSILVVSIFKTLFRKKKKKGMISKASDVINVVSPLISIVKKVHFVNAN